ncbi:glycosyltransferase family 2 protein [Segetibacter aerophilus]|uniref:Glycosyl transferase family A n=1 Tax=Segetibacter aerophilus TaxID=670293 RepID=A0A512BFQ0_9BACT|nr:glycosyltransferase family A protein [Segetibacter aerophilus]GEO10790.1 glycosyl transferase family A [Segetibacter aerophilus]
MSTLFIPPGIRNIWKNVSAADRIEIIKTNNQRLKKSGVCDVSIIIPAFNEEKNILKTLHSLAVNTTAKSVEIIVVNNNSSDNTEELVRPTSVKCILEKKQGITAARNAGLQVAAGKYILNADADTIYPYNWIDAMVAPLEKDTAISLTYGRFCFIPTGGTSRFTYFLYESATNLLRRYNRHFKEEAVNVYGFNSCFRREHGLAVEGFNHPVGSNEDGWLALKLRDKGFGKLRNVTTSGALVWTTDRRIQMEGGFLKGLNKRIAKTLFPQRFTEVRTDL